MLDKKWHVLSQYQPGGIQASLFIAKLRKQTGWSKNFCLEAIEEYKRFVYLTSVSQGPLTPSIVVDEVWHLHLTFSRDYWENMCKNIIGCTLHHDPANAFDGARTKNQYEGTQKMYLKYFKTSLPKKFWCDTQEAQKPTRAVTKFAAVPLLFFATTAWASTGESGVAVFFISFFIVVLFLFGFISSSSAKTKRNANKKNSTHDNYGACGSAGLSTNDTKKSCSEKSGWFDDFFGGGSGGSGSSCGSSCGGGE